MSPIPFEREYLRHVISFRPFFLTENHFGRKVEYVPDVQRRKDDAVRFEVNAGRVDAQISDPTGIVSLKSPDWAFQEYRFVLLIVPSSVHTARRNVLLEEFSR